MGKKGGDKIETRCEGITLHAMHVMILMIPSKA